MVWGILFLAGLFEVCWALALKQSDGFTRIGPTVVFGVCAWLSFALMSQALKVLPIGTSYAVWTGIGAVGVAVAGILWFGENASPARLLCITLIVAGIVGLNITGTQGGAG